MKKFLNINTILIGGLLVISLAAFWYINSNKTQGSKAIVQVENDKEKIEISLEKDGVYEIHAKLPVKLKVQNGAIAFVDSQCPDKLCEGYGFIKHEGENAICLPANVVVLIDEAG